VRKRLRLPGSHGFGLKSLQFANGDSLPPAIGFFPPRPTAGLENEAERAGALRHRRLHAPSRRAEGAGGGGVVFTLDHGANRGGTKQRLATIDTTVAHVGLANDTPIASCDPSDQFRQSPDRRAMPRHLKRSSARSKGAAHCTLWAASGGPAPGRLAPQVAAHTRRAAFAAGRRQAAGFRLAQRASAAGKLRSCSPTQYHAQVPARPTRRSQMQSNAEPSQDCSLTTAMTAIPTARTASSHIRRRRGAITSSMDAMSRFPKPSKTGP
jgi:hypothetical protein